MSLMIRLTQFGRRGESKFRIIVKEKRSKRDGSAVDTIGSYEKKVGKVIKTINQDKLKLWISRGAQMSATVKNLVEMK